MTMTPKFRPRNSCVCHHDLVNICALGFDEKWCRSHAHPTRSGGPITLVFSSIYAEDRGSLSLEIRRPLSAASHRSRSLRNNLLSYSNHCLSKPKRTADYHGQELIILSINQLPVTIETIRTMVARKLTSMR
jgi:hypothetical protein